MYIPLDVDLPDHPKTRRLRLRLHCDQGTAVGYLACLWSWAFKYAPDGDLSRFEAEEIEDAAGWGGEPGQLHTLLVDCGWIDGGKRPGLHDWHDHSGKLVAKRAADRVRMRRFRERHGDETQPPTEDETHTQRERNANVRVESQDQERRGEEIKKKETPKGVEKETTPNGVFVPKPQAVSAPTPSDWQSRAEEALTASWFPEKLKLLGELLAEENKTGKTRLSRVVTALYEPLVACQETLSRDALAYGLDAAIARPAANVNYVKRAAANYVPNGSRPAGIWRDVDPVPEEWKQP
jgi:hypothetical protein